jgi:hypothetical protein
MAEVALSRYSGDILDEGEAGELQLHEPGTSSIWRQSVVEIRRMPA